ncbi:delta-sterol C-methyltransferase [Thelephora terrestris]|uniref:Sterol 24-C-methyltransferase n=1 Tax=Thelephora terrestris TaxID=56493 RepID=A0A9P6HJP7_9AGAM|nr:delta-sterol C-methyltransferase [Thelephora terrestris]
MADARSTDRIGNYTKFWDKDMQNEKSEVQGARVDNYAEVVNGYYDGATELYEFAWAQSFHFSRFNKGEAFNASLARHEHYLALRMGLKPGMRVLDVGCGVGGPAREISRFADVNVVGLNNNAFQVGRATKYAKEINLQDQVRFVKGDFMDLVGQFGENSFDAVYAIEATCHAPTWEGVYGQIFKVLKPGGIFGVYEWCMTDEWNPSNPEHKALAHEIELGNGIPEMRPLSKARAALTTVGFDVEYEEDLAERPDVVKWYYPLEGDIWKAQTAWDMLTVWGTSWSGMLITHTIMWIMELLGLLPKGTLEVVHSLKSARTGLVKGGQMKLFTPMYLAISKKPLNRDS